MPLTRSFKETVQLRVNSDPEFRSALLEEALDTFLEGDVDTGKSIMRDYINATIGFETLGKATGTSTKSLMRMFGPQGNPSIRNLFSVIEHIQQFEGIRLKVETVEKEEEEPNLHLCPA
ncbi:MAG: transcriptional regulator [Chloroflexi bacterium AL-W]|nr:transcriptional regulator [Chloroflexi bacterium AL-N1]NOK71064.1 transcriptional regulator [Chloroflexi bacterium AL-N10]NOK72714.1 transcriptional regulator [Chloroflexi bacterium AL-N5]NOK79198.1 transcriptional regulator [Chloroflexi bacterium AL-W]NOK87114.1 transcriptional regulator [Chloroflexi bacterium AL-N15]